MVGVDVLRAILAALDTFVIPQCLSANKWVIARAVDTDTNALMTNGSDPSWEIPGCGSGYDGHSVCGAYYWDQAIDVVFTLTSNDNPSLDPTSNVQSFFGNRTTLDLLFHTAQCQVQGGSAPTVSVGNSGVTASCLSNVKVYTW